MDIIPLTLGLSLLLSLTFIALFLREFTRPRRAGGDHDSLLPFEPETTAATSTEPAHHHAHHHAEGERCAGADPTKPRCSACQRRQARLAEKAAARAAAAPAA